jgi:hypothetical protein
MAGYATQAWVNTNFVSIEFFGRLFKAYGPGENQGDPDVEVLPNDMDSTISNIEAMFGFWTDFYLTALGNGGEIGASIYLSGLADVNVAGVQTGQVLTWNAATNKWIATTPSSGVDMNQVWNALAAQTSQQINASHLATALAGYATQTWVGQQGYITSSGSCAYATNAGTATYATSAGSAQSAGYASSIPQHSLWGQSFDGTNNVSGDMSSVGHMIFSHSETQFKYTSGGSTQYTDPAPGEDYNFKFGGSLAATYLGARYGIASQGYVTALSDEREKNIIEDFEIPLDFIGKAPIVSYEWKDTERRGDKQHIGSIAQYWLREMPELVPEVNGRYTMDYGRIALLSAILTARHVVNLEQRIAELEKTRGE